MNSQTNKLLNTENKLLLLRNRVIELTRNKIQSPQQSVKLSNSLIQLQPQIIQYVIIIRKAIQTMEQNNQQPTFSKKGEFFQNSKVNIFLWQILNFICINSQMFPKDFQKIISLLLKVDFDFEISQSVNSLKNAHIFIHNLVCKVIKNGQYQQYKACILEWFSSLLAYHFQRKQNKYLHFAIKFQCRKGEETIISEMEWLGYIFHQLFNGQNQFEGSTIQQIVSSFGNIKIAYYVLHMIGNYFQEMVDKRVTTELVSGFECSLLQVKQMYQAKDVCLAQIKISKADLAYICQMFKIQISKIRCCIKQYIQFFVKENKDADSTAILQKWNDSIQIVMEICNIFNCILFIGGYNNKLQDFVSQYLLEKDKILLTLLEMSYLLYRNIQSTKFQSKLALMIQVERQAKLKLFKLFQVDVDFQTIDVKSLHLERILTDGQLVCVLRLLSNLVHINHRAQLPFQSNPQYLHMILSLTHDSVSQITMKEWAIMFIRNICEWSEKLRNEIGKIKMEVKME